MCIAFSCVFSYDKCYFWFGSHFFSFSQAQAFGNNFEDRVRGLPVCFTGDPVEPIPADVQVEVSYRSC